MEPDARLSWRVLPILILYGITTRATVRVGQEQTIFYKYNRWGLEASAGARAGARLCSSSGKVAQRSAAVITSERIRELGERSASAPR
eukprot:840294-Pleurochrysis_carterae.AAC.1